MCNTNKRTLIHYDEIGLFQPSYVDENGYRYYTERQCDTFLFISYLKQLGMPLKEIKTYVTHRTPSTFQSLLQTQQKKVLEEINSLLKLQEIIQTKLDLVALSNKAHLLPHVFVEEIEDEYLVTSPFLNTNNHDQIIHAIYQHISYCTIHNLSCGYPYGAMIETKQLMDSHWDHYAYFFTKINHIPKEHPFHIKPKGYYIATYLKGNYYDSEHAYSTLLTYAKSHNLQLGAYSYKEGILDEACVSDEEAFLTKISIPIVDKP